MLRATCAARTGRGANSGRPAAKAVWLAGTNLKPKDVSEGVMLWESCLCIAQLVSSLRHHCAIEPKIVAQMGVPLWLQAEHAKAGRVSKVLVTE